MCSYQNGSVRLSHSTSMTLRFGTTTQLNSCDFLSATNLSLRTWSTHLLGTTIVTMSDASRNRIPRMPGGTYKIEYRAVQQSFQFNGCRIKPISLTPAVIRRHTHAICLYLISLEKSDVCRLDLLLSLLP
jgi:hypothetical protein